MRPGLVTRTTCPSCCGATAACGVAALEPVAFATWRRIAPLLLEPAVGSRGCLESQVEGQRPRALPPRSRSCGLDRRFLALARPLALFALVGIEPAFPETDRFRCHL